MASLNSIKSVYSDEQLDAVMHQGYMPRGNGFVDSSTGKFVSGDVVDKIAKSSTSTIGSSILNAFGIQKNYSGVDNVPLNVAKAIPRSVANDNRASVGLFSKMVSLLYEIKSQIKSQVDLQRAVYLQTSHNQKEDRLENKRSSAKSGIISEDGQITEGKAKAKPTPSQDLLGSLMGVAFGVGGGKLVATALTKALGKVADLTIGALIKTAGGVGAIVTAVIPIITSLLSSPVVLTALAGVAAMAVIDPTTRKRLAGGMGLADYSGNLIVRNKPGSKDPQYFMTQADGSEKEISKEEADAFKNKNNAVITKNKPVTNDQTGGTDYEYAIGKDGKLTPIGKAPAVDKLGKEGSVLKGAAKRYSDYFVEHKGWSRTMADGAAAGLWAESGEGGYRSKNPTSGAYGLAQWLSKDRISNFEKRYKKKISESTEQEQLDFVDWEYRNTEKSAWEKLKKSKTREDALHHHTDAFERPGPGYLGDMQRGLKALGGAWTNLSEGISKTAHTVNDWLHGIGGGSIAGQHASKGMKYKYQWDLGSKPLEKSKALSDWKDEAKTTKIPNIPGAKGTSPGSIKSAPLGNMTSVPNPNSAAGLDYLLYFTGGA